MYLDILHVFYTYPKRVQDTFWDTHQIHQDTCILSASLVSHWIHFTIHQDTCILDSSSRYILWYIRIQPEIQNHDTCILDASWRGTYLRCKIHAGYMWDTCICKGDQDTCGIHSRYMMRYMYLKCIQREMYLIWIETCGIHAGYMRDTCGIHAGHVSRGFGGIQAPPQVGLEIRILECIPLYLTCIVHVSCVSCIWGLRYIVF